MTSIELPPPPPSTEALRVLTGQPLRDILRERVEQIDVHGFNAAHDAGHSPATLALAASSYIAEAVDQLSHRGWVPTGVPDSWPFEDEAWKPGDARAHLIKGIAIAWAVLDRLDADLPRASAEAA